MANRRFSANTHFTNTQLYDRDIIPFTHNNAGDGKIGLGQLQCLPIAKCTSSSGTVNKTATMQNLGQFSLEGISAEKLVGRRIGVIFTNENTATNPTLNIASTEAYPITTHGVPVGNKAIKAGNYTVTLYPYGNSYCWDIDNDGVVSVSGSTVTYYDGSVVPLNSALTDLNVKSITPTITIPSERWGTYTVNYVKMQQVGNFYFCYGSIIVGTDATKQYLYLIVNGGSGVNFDRTSGWRLDSRVCILNDTSEGMLVSVSNNSLWVKKNHSTGNNSEATTFTGLELAGKTVTFSFMASKIS